MVEAFTALEVGLPRGRASAIFEKKTQAHYCQDRLQAQAPLRGKGSMDGTKPLTQDEHNDEIQEATKSFLQAAGLSPDLSIVPGQPFRLGLIRHLLQLMHDPDTGLMDIADSGFHTGVFESIQFLGIWRRQQSECARRPAL